MRDERRKRLLGRRDDLSRDVQLLQQQQRATRRTLPGERPAAVVRPTKVARQEAAAAVAHLQLKERQHENAPSKAGPLVTHVGLRVEAPTAVEASPRAAATCEAPQCLLRRAVNSLGRANAGRAEALILV